MTEKITLTHTGAALALDGLENYSFSPSRLTLDIGPPAYKRAGHVCEKACLG